MRNFGLTVAFILYPLSSYAAGDTFFSLKNTDFIVSLSFALFVGILLYLKVPNLLAGLLDKRADGIRTELDEAKKLREEAQTLLASYERKQKEIAEQAERIIKNAKEEAKAVAAQAQKDLEISIERRMQAAVEQLESAEVAAILEIRDTAISVAIAVASEVIQNHSKEVDQDKFLEESILEVSKKLH
ncbi:MAG: F0F1 ATP synthase subunit B [Paracoccaceae bacterium]|jgi:F-type H+-transporting ATPase subunit b|nr:F0F1 ATP synthase subunit B [Paracoccaceae bacterium]